MLLRECTDGVDKVTSVDDFKKYYPDTDYSQVKKEFDAIVAELNRIGDNVYAADQKYFPRLHRGVYHTKMNNFYLNIDYLYDPEVLLSVTRHEGWHAAQDCMAGSLDNTSIAVIYHDGVVPEGYYVRANLAYRLTPQVVPWEAEAMYASETDFATQNALAACKRPDAMWLLYPPTPKTAEWKIVTGKQLVVSVCKQG